MQGIDAAEFEKWARKIDELGGKIKEEKKKILDQLGRDALQAVWHKVPGSGKVRYWQTLYKGSGGGYTAVRAQNKADGVYPATGAKSPGAITNYVNSGHTLRGDKDKWFEGRQFYQAAEREMEAVTPQKVEAMLEEIAARLEGG